MMKKLVYRAGAVIMAALLFFCSIIYSSIPVYAAGLVEVATQAGWAALGYFVGEGIDKVREKLGWKASDIQVDENGNVILSEAQMNELKDAIESYTQDEDGNDKYGMYLYESTNGYSTVESAMIAQTYNVSKSWNQQLISSGTSHIWVRYVSSTASGYATFAPNSAVWIALSSNYAVTFYNQSGTGFVYTDDWYFTNNDHTWSVRSQAYTSAGPASIYGGPGHVAFKTIEDYRAYIEDGSPYTLVAPTYTGGDLVIPADQLHDPDAPDDPSVSGNDFDDDGNPVTEKGWLQKIYERLGDILDQVKQIKWLTVVDVVINAIDTFGESVGNIASALVDAISQVFPLCILWDVVRIVEIFEAEPIPPVFDINLKWDLIGVDQTFKLDLTQYDLIFTFLRMGEIITFLLELSRITMEWVGKGDDII